MEYSGCIKSIVEKVNLFLPLLPDPLVCGGGQSADRTRSADKTGKPAEKGRPESEKSRCSAELIITI